MPAGDWSGCGRNGSGLGRHPRCDAVPVAGLAHPVVAAYRRGQAADARGARHGGALVGLFPFYATPGRHRRAVAVPARHRHHRLPRCPGAARAGGCGDGGRLRPSRQAAGGWDVVRMAAAPRRLAAARPGAAGLGEQVEPPPSPARPAPAGQHRCAAARVSAKTLRDLRPSPRARQAGTLRWETESDGIEAPFEALLRLHAARWATRAKPACSPPPPCRPCTARPCPPCTAPACCASTCCGWTARSSRCSTPSPIRRAGPAGASTSTSVASTRALERLSPGMLLVGRAVEAAIAEGFACRRLPARPRTYKYFWGAEDSRPSAAAWCRHAQPADRARQRRRGRRAGCRGATAMPAPIRSDTWPPPPGCGCRRSGRSAWPASWGSTARRPRRAGGGCGSAPRARTAPPGIGRSPAWCWRSPSRSSGLPARAVRTIEAEAGIRFLGNRPASGTQIIDRVGRGALPDRPAHPLHLGRFRAADRGA